MSLPIETPLVPDPVDAADAMKKPFTPRTSKIFSVEADKQVEESEPQLPQLLTS